MTFNSIIKLPLKHNPILSHQLQPWSGQAEQQGSQKSATQQSNRKRTSQKRSVSSFFAFWTFVSWQQSALSHVHVVYIGHISIQYLSFVDIAMAAIQCGPCRVSAVHTWLSVWGNVVILPETLDTTTQVAAAVPCKALVLSKDWTLQCSLFTVKQH